MKHNRRHLTVIRRSVAREQQLPLLDASFTDLAARLAGSLTGAHAHVVREENRLAVRAALEKMNKVDRTVLVLRYLEQLSMREIAEVLGATEVAIKKRHVRALQRISVLLPDPRT
jgi:RNA polymerase sigma-70 factor (ECF subfamily)